MKYPIMESEYTKTKRIIAFYLQNVILQNLNAMESACCTYAYTYDYRTYAYMYDNRTYTRTYVELITRRGLRPTRLPVTRTAIIIIFGAVAFQASCHFYVKKFTAQRNVKFECSSYCYFRRSRTRVSSLVST
jgi:hypothetical protein